ncbi:MAG: XRE family transcriptional regulator [Caulobacteraceae bacterium]|nr:XRE family transcriptional regulator [Caulobacteraceae bacterium]
MNLKQYLTSRNIRQVEFAELAGLSAPVVSKLCNPKRAPRASLATLRRIYAATGGAVTADDLLGLHGLVANNPTPAE